jgi:hypothetical protein
VYGSPCETGKQKPSERGHNILRIKDEFIYAGKKAVKTEQLESTWPIYKDYQVVEEDGRLYVYAPLRPPERPEEAVVQIGQPDLNLDRMYSPLRDVPDLFLRFASLAPRKPLSDDDKLERMLKWARSYGVLGSKAHTVGLIADNPRTLDYSAQPDRVQSLFEFQCAVQEAALCLRLYQAATANQGLGDEGELSEVLSEQNRKNKSLDLQRERALMRAQIIAHAHITEQCYPVLARQLRRTTNNTYETAGFSQGWGYRSLLGAMYLQMMWLMTIASNVKRCEGPDCINIITFDPPESPISPEKGARGKYRTRSDKRFCSENCKSKSHYHNTIKPRRATNDS